MYTCLFSLDMNKKHYYIEPRSVSQNGSNTFTYIFSHDFKKHDLVGRVPCASDGFIRMNQLILHSIHEVSHHHHHIRAPAFVASLSGSHSDDERNSTKSQASNYLHHLHHRPSFLTTGLFLLFRGDCC